MARELDEQLARRPAERPFHINPRAILVVRLNRPIADALWGAVEILELDGRELESTVAFSAEEDLSSFLRRLDDYRNASPSARGHLVGADLFDRIESIRFYGAQDRITPRLRDALQRIPGDAAIDVDIEIWHPGDAGAAEEAREWTDVVRRAIEEADGVVLDWYTNHDVGLLMLRARLTANTAAELAELDEIAVIDLKPVPPEGLAGATDLRAEDLPAIAAPAADAPLVAVIDSGVNGGHPLIGPALYEATTLVPGLADGADENGHGTAVAGIALHGQTEEWLQTAELRPFARLLSIRVLDERGGFPDEQLWPNAVVAAVEHAVQRGCRVINLAIGDRDGKMTDRRATRVAALLDDLIRRHGVVIVVPTGNVEDVREYLEPSLDVPDTYVRALLESTETTLLDPGPAALALTVGGLGAEGLLQLGEYVVGSSSSPSAQTRRGPGIARGIKPELAAPAGTIAVNDMGFRARRQLQLLVLAHGADELLTHTMGTSFAAPVATRVATAVQAQYPGISSQLTRALVLQSSQMPAFDESLLPEGTKGEQLRSRLDLMGHGAPSIDGARFSATGRVVLIADGRLPVDKVLIYEVPLPDSFFETGGTRTIDIAVCFDPLTRYRRKDYLGSRLFPYLFHGPTVDEIITALAEADDDELVAQADEILVESGEQPVAAQPGDGDVDLESADEPTSTKGPLASLKRFRFGPSTAVSSDSANILLRARRPQRLDSDLPRVAHLAIRSTRRWAPEATEDPFGIAVALGHSGVDVDLHAELRQRIEQSVELEIELDA